MQGTLHVRSLFRLLIGAVLLCLAWLVLTSGHASAAERPGPSRPLDALTSTLPPVDDAALETALGDVLGQRPAPAPPASDDTRPASTTKPEKASGTTRSTSAPTKSPATIHPSDAVVAEPARPAAPAPLAPVTLVTGTVDGVATELSPVLAGVRPTTRATVDTALALVTDLTELAAAVPVAGEPADRVADALVGLVHTLPGVGVPSPIVPLPIGDGTPTDVVPTVPPAPAVVAAGDPSSSTGHPGAAGARPTWLDLGGSASPRDLAVAASSGGHGPHGGGAPFGSWTPFQPPPATPTQPSPTGAGTAQANGDPAAAAPSLQFPHSSQFGRSSADWRVPRGLPAHPGTRPD